MAKNLKLNIKNAQIAQAVNLSGLKKKLAKKREEEADEPHAPPTDLPPASKESKIEGEESPREETPRIRARSKSAFAEPHPESAPKESQESVETAGAPSESQPFKGDLRWKEEEPLRIKTSAELRQEIFGDELSSSSAPATKKMDKGEGAAHRPATAESASAAETAPSQPAHEPHAPAAQSTSFDQRPTAPIQEVKRPSPPPVQDKLGPTGRHIKDYFKPKPSAPARTAYSPPPASTQKPPLTEARREKPGMPAGKPKQGEPETAKTAASEESKGPKPAKFKEFRDLKPTRRQEGARQFDARDRQGLRTADDERQWRKRRGKSHRPQQQEEAPLRPTSLKIRVPISIKELASEMKLKASQLIGKLFLQGSVVTLNDFLEDETTLQLLGHEFGCEITLDTSEEKRIRITDHSIKEELSETPRDQLILRPPVVAFMGHVDHGKTSLIDAIRASNRVAGEAGAITQHIGAFRCQTPIGNIAILDTPGHEAFSAMRARGADVTDIVVLVVAGDEGIKQQTIEAIQHARSAGVIIVVAINKSDKPNFNAENIYRQLAEQNLLPESWGGQTITVNCSAVTHQGIPELLEMLALQAEILELRANPSTRARGTVLESEMHKGMGAIATLLVQNGTLKKGDSLVFGQFWGKVKTMHDEHHRELQEAGPSTPVEVTGLSGLPEAGQEFIVVANEKEAREIAEARSEGARQSYLLLQQKKKSSMEHLFQQASSKTGKKILNLLLRADVQGSLEALRVGLLNIQSDKVEVNIIFEGVGEISESDVQLAAASKAVVVGFHTQIESHAEPLVKQLSVQVRLHDVIYHAIDDVRTLMGGLLEKIPQETEKGKALVKATFKSSHAGVIAGCQVTEGTIHRNHNIRVKRGEEVVWKGTIASIKRVKEDVREVQKGLECGILLNNFSDVRENDVLEAYEVTYIVQEL